MELNATNISLARSYVWGLGLSETMDGAGGVGGFLWVRSHTASGAAAGTHFVAYDGNGNVVALVSATAGTETARYEYGPFGEPIRITGPAAGQNPFRFSTKRTCPTTDLVLYEYRAYSATLGRWLSRDPMGEFGFDAVTSAGTGPCKERGPVVCRANAYGAKGRRAGVASCGPVSLASPKGGTLAGANGEALRGRLAYVFVVNNPLLHLDPTGLDCPGCDLVSEIPGIGPVFETDCALRCCAKHDECYDLRNCSAWSWLIAVAKLAACVALEVPPELCLGIPVTACDDCNVRVIHCMVGCTIGIDPGGEKYYCARQHKYIRIGFGGDFPNLRAAKECCCN